jgi:protein-tyrosine phosphatase
MVVTDTVSRVHGILNMRDLGGLETSDGHRVAPNHLYRSGSPHEMTREDRSALEELGIRIVIDLRSEWERRQHPYEWPNSRIVSAPLIDDRLVASINARFKTGTISGGELKDWWQLTRLYHAPEDHISSIRKVFATLIEADSDDAILFHCRGGKDRTGVVAALVLEALGVTREGILADFMLSDELSGDKRGMGRLAAIIDAAAPTSLDDEARAALTGVRRKWLDTLLRRIEDRCGSVTSYLTDDVGIGDRGLARLREMHLEPGIRY